ncbi:uncharacterized protein LOC141721482 isoform X1 [Apium graveolens]|uniref:uncharacterized protein LOC141721482 isoform X1 n=1 Tax=Apium graveolens TaxID=4045 RepID=UPI003D795148
MATSLPWRTSLPSRSQHLHFHHSHLLSTRHSTSLHASRRSNFDDFSSRFHSGQLWRDFWRTANEGFEQFVYETQKISEKIDRKFNVSRRFGDVAESAKYRAKEIDRDLRISEKWRIFCFDFNIYFPLYRERITDFFNSTLGQTIMMIFFLWFFLSGWLIRCIVIFVWFVPVVSPILMAAFGNFFIVKGSCPACQRPFVGLKARVVRCLGCRNTVWQPKGGKSSSSSSKPEIIDVEFEEK